MSSHFALNYGGNHSAVKKWWHITKRRFVVVLKYFHKIKCLFHQMLIKMINTSVLIYCVRVYKPIYLTYLYITVRTNKIPVTRSPCRLNSVRWRLSFVDSQWRTYSCHPSGAWNLEAVPRFVEDIYIPVCVPTGYSSGLGCFMVFWFFMECYFSESVECISTSVNFWPWCCLILAFELVQWLIFRSITVAASPGYVIKDWIKLERNYELSNR